ncbi:hypothetical protein MBCUT_15430 [Methanobrevibacter cuticularis]|uniref:Uncharacterized protein n=1 Tax=Methanobrevibacter cuticularis TaxID=47311 RepID=A0A166DBH2_9EURY|nr:hypothetical protein [Methanobrevibacter cuticularis]KZX15410.1 hypothetical protein MBCUT_15430 [Methanobrevibacter cuticularis]
MDILTASIYIILFIVLMILIFSMGLSAPLIEKKGAVLVLVIGFIVGIVGGAFFISPIYSELPYVAGSLQEIIDGDSEFIGIVISPTTDNNALIQKLNATEGVISVTNKGISLKTDNFSSERKAIIEEKMPDIDTNFKSWTVDPSGEITLNITENYDPNNAISLLSEWLMFTGGINTNYALLHLQLNVKASHTEEIKNYLNSENIVVSSVEGPVQDTIKNTKNSMLDNNIIILVSGLFGVVIALIGLFFDEIILFFRKVIKRIKDR